VTTFYFIVPWRTNFIGAVSWQRSTIHWRTGNNNWRYIETVLYYSVHDRTNLIDAVSCQHNVILRPYRKEYTRLTLYRDNVIYDVPERINSINAVSWQRYTSTYQKNKLNRRCIMTTLYYDVPERTNSIDVVSWQCNSMTYRKEQTRLMLYYDNVFLWRTGKNKHE